MTAKASESPKPRVFITYTDIDRNGKRFGNELKKELERLSYDVFFFDHSGRRHLGRPLWDVLAEEIDKRDAVIVVCTQAITASYGADFEYNHALSRDKLVIPLKYDDAQVPGPLASRIRDNFDDTNYTEKFESVAKTLPESYSKHVTEQKERQEIRAKFQKPPTVAPKLVRPSASGVKLLQSIVRSYNEASLIQDLTVVENYQPSIHEHLSFIQIGLRVAIPREWMEQTNRVILVDELGVSVALGERNYLRDVWSAQAAKKAFSKEKLVPEEFQRILQEMSSGINPVALLAPIDYYVTIASWMRQRVIRWELGKSFFLLEDGRPLRIYWSNKYAPLDNFVLVDSSATRWVVKPDPETGGRLTATFVENEKDLDKIDFLVKTVGTVEFVSPTGIKIFNFE